MHIAEILGAPLPFENLRLKLLQNSATKIVKTEQLFLDSFPINMPLMHQVWWRACLDKFGFLEKYPKQACRQLADHLAQAVNLNSIYWI